MPAFTTLSGIGLQVEQLGKQPSVWWEKITDKWLAKPLMCLWIYKVNVIVVRKWDSTLTDG